MPCLRLPLVSALFARWLDCSFVVRAEIGSRRAVFSLDSIVCLFKRPGPTLFMGIARYLLFSLVCVSEEFSLADCCYENLCPRGS